MIVLAEAVRVASDLKTRIKDIIAGEVSDTHEDLERYSHDASMFELTPELIVYPKNARDVSKLVRFVADNKQDESGLSIVARSGGTDMSGAAIGESIIMDMTRHLNKIHSVSSISAQAQPGVYYRDFEKATLEHGAYMPSYPASREICTIGGMVANNSGGEKSLQHGKTEKFVQELKVVYADGNEYTVKPLDRDGLKAKMAQDDYEGSLYRSIFELIEENYELIKSAKPGVSKDSTGYHLWNVWDRQTGVFDLTQLITGSQGTLGIVTDIKFRLVAKPKHSGTLVIFLREIDDLGDLINDVLRHRPSAFEGFDNHTLLLSVKLFMYFRKTLGWAGMIKLGVQLIPDALMLFRGIPEMVLIVQLEGENPKEVIDKIHALRRDLRPYRQEALFEENASEAKSRKFWIMRRESFNLLRKKVKDKHTAPFIDDLVVPPEKLPQFLPEVRKIIKKYKLLATIQGHMGDGNFHIIPLMEIEKESERAKLEPAMREVNKLVLKYGGSLSGEHNDGLIRGPWLLTMYGREMFEVLERTKEIFDPANIFNPHKKTDATWDYSFSHIREKF